jgi:predicted ATPase
MADLTERQRFILALVVHEYTRTAAPVVSRHLVEQYHLDMSSATIRNELAALTDGEQVLPSLAAVFELRSMQGSSLLNTLTDYLRGKALLLVLDNFEHLLPAATYLVELLEAAPGLRIMVTSRERLNLYQEIIFQVRGLPYPFRPDDPAFSDYSGIKLFTQNAQRVAPGFNLRPEDRSSIILICALTDGLPLGIELASSWVRAFTCREIANSIQGNLDFLRTGSPDVPTRHRSLRAAFDHSWSLLSEEDRRIVRRLSIFRNGFTTQAAQTLANASLFVLANFVDKSLITRHSSGRYEMPETLRVYAEEKLHADPQEFQAYMDAFSEYYGDYLQQKFGEFSREGGALALEEVKLENNNIQHAMIWAMNRDSWSVISRAINPLFTYYELMGMFRDGHDLAEIYLNRLVDLNVVQQQPSIYHSILGWLGWFKFRLGYTEQGIKRLEEWLEHTSRHGLPADTASALMLLADTQRRLDNHAKALELIDRACEIYQQIGEYAYQGVGGILGYALTIKGSILLSLNQIEEASQVLEESKRNLQKAGARYGMIRYLDVQATLEIRKHNYEESHRLRLQAMDIAEEFGDRGSIAKILNNLSQSAEYINDLQGAIFFLEKAASICDETGDRQLAAICNNNLGYYTLKYYGDTQRSIPYYQKSLAMFRDLNNPRGVYYTLRDITRPYLMIPDLSMAQKCLEEALQVGEHIGEPEIIEEVLPMLARFLAASGRKCRAEQLCAWVLEHANLEKNLRMETRQLLADLRAELSGSDGQESTEPLTELPTFEQMRRELLSEALAS